MLSTKVFLNPGIIAIFWPLVYGIYLPVAFREGGTNRLWHDTKVLAVIMCLFFLLLPRLYFFDDPSRNHAAIETIVFPLSVFAAAFSTNAFAFLKLHFGLQCLLSVIFALLFVLLGIGV